MGSSVSDPYGSLAEAPARFDASTDLTLAIEEEFQILDRETLSLRNGFRELQAMAVGTPLEEHLAGELIECEVEVKTGRCETFAEAARLTSSAGGDLYGRRRPARRRALRPTGTHPWSPWTEQSIIDTPALPARRAIAALRGLAQQHVRDPRACGRAGPRPSDRADEPAALDPSRPAGAECELALVRRPRDVPALDALAALHADVPALRHPRAVRGLGRLRRVRAASCSTPARSASTRRSGGACARTSRSARSSCATPTARRTCARRSRSRPSAT